MDEVMGMLSTLNPGVDYANETALVDDGILDSMTIVRLIVMIGEEFDVEIGVTDLTRENFNSVQAIVDLIHRLEE